MAIQVKIQAAESMSSLLRKRAFGLIFSNIISTRTQCSEVTALHEYSKVLKEIFAVGTSLLTKLFQYTVRSIC